MRKKPTQSTINKLISLSGNRCAFPGCEQPLVNEGGTLIGEICHIEASEPGGQRYNQNQTDEDRCGLSNLMLLCANHHHETDDTTKYSVATLGQMKADHEKDYYTQPYVPSEQVVRQLDRILEVTQNPRPLNSYSVEIITDAQHKADMAEVQRDFADQAQSNMSRFPGSSVQVANMAYQKMATKKRRSLMMKKAASDRMYELERQDIEDQFAEKLGTKQHEINERGLTYSGIGNQELAKVEQRKERELEKLKIKYGKE